MRDLYVRLYLDILANRKLVGANANAKWLYVAGFVVAARELSDGHLRPPVAVAEAEVPTSAVKVLVDRGLWHRPGHGCDRCPQPVQNHVVIHDYLDHQESRTKVEASKAAKSAAGKKGADSRWHSKRHDRSDSMSHSNTDDRTMADLDADLDQSVQVVSQSQTDGLTDDEIEKIRKRLGASSSTHARKVADEVLARADAVVLRPFRYVLKAIDLEPDRYKPTPGPTRKSDECEIHPGQPGSNCGGCRSELIAGGAVR